MVSHPARPAGQGHHSTPSNLLPRASALRSIQTSPRPAALQQTGTRREGRYPDHSQPPMVVIDTAFQSNAASRPRSGGSLLLKGGLSRDDGDPNEL